MLDDDGSLTIYAQADPPPEEQHTNWPPAPKDADLSLFIRVYWPEVATLGGIWTPPPLKRTEIATGTSVPSAPDK